MISVIIPHYNQPEELARCLAALGGQQAGGHPVEIIVVDNGSVQKPDEVVARFDNVRLMEEAEPGPGPARNRGAAVSKGEILAFIDADCVADENWLATIAAEFADPSAEILGGDVRILHGDPKRPTAIEAYESEFAYRMEHYIRRQNFTGTGNLAVRRAVFEGVGPFAGIGIAEDRDWGQRAHAMGHVTRWVPGMRAFHPARTTFAELARKWDRHTAHDFETMIGKPGGRPRWIARSLAMAVSPLAALPRIISSGRIGGGVVGRLKALAVLVGIRLYRARLMIPLIFARNAERLSRRWRDQG